MSTDPVPRFYFRFSPLYIPIFVEFWDVTYGLSLLTCVTVFEHLAFSARAVDAEMRDRELGFEPNSHQNSNFRNIYIFLTGNPLARKKMCNLNNKTTIYQKPIFVKQNGFFDSRKTFLCVCFDGRFGGHIFYLEKKVIFGIFLSNPLTRIYRFFFLIVLGEREFSIIKSRFFSIVFS